MAMKLERAIFENSIGTILKAFNEPTVEAIKSSYIAVQNLGDSNSLVEQFEDQSRNIQTVVNDFSDQADKYIEETQTYCDIADYMQTKATVGEVTKRDVTVEMDKADADLIMV